MKAEMATKASPPGRFSITTGWPQRAASRSANSRAPMSDPEPGPSGRMNLTGCCGQFAVCDCTCVASSHVGATAMTASSRMRERSFIGAASRMNQRSKATLYHKSGVAMQPLLRSRRPQVLRVHEAVGGRQRSFEVSGLAHERDHLLQSLELDLPVARKNASLGPEKEIE